MRLTVAEELERLRTLRELRGDRLDPVPSILTLDDAVRKAAESRSRCSLCHCEIPPGRAGRKCQACREEPSPEELGHTLREFVETHFSVDEMLNAGKVRVVFEKPRRS